MFSFSTFDVLLLGLVIAIVKMNQKNKPSLTLNHSRQGGQLKNKNFN
ncbi:hypothetical protein MXL69_12260 [Mammaliicoccus sciuri]|nr:hypothetical protein [Mammaliicoccus sciuri]